METLNGVGSQLASARQAKGMSQAEVAKRLRISVHQVAAIDAEDIHHLPPPVFLRGFLRSYAHLVDLDPALLATVEAAGNDTPESLTVPTTGVTLSMGRVRKWLLIMPALVMGFFVLVMVIYLWLKQGSGPAAEAVETPTPPVAAPAATSANPVAPDAKKPVLKPPAPAPAFLVPASLAPATPASAPAALPVPPPTRVAMAPMQPSLPAEPVQKTEGLKTDAAGSMLTFSVREDSWIRITDATGRQSQRLARPGTIERFRGRPPFELIIGNAAFVDLSYNGRNIDLKPFTGDRVARLTLE